MIWDNARAQAHRRLAALGAGLVLALALAACAGPDRPVLARYPQAARLTDAELRALFPAHVDYFSEKLGPSTAAFAADGSLSYQLFSANFKDKGTWRIAEGKLCTRYEFLGSGQAQCHWIYRIEPERYAVLAADGSHPLTFTVFNGPAEPAGAQAAVPAGGPAGAPAGGPAESPSESPAATPTETPAETPAEPPTQH